MLKFKETGFFIYLSALLLAGCATPLEMLQERLKYEGGLKPLDISGFLPGKTVPLRTSKPPTGKGEPNWDDFVYFDNRGFAHSPYFINHPYTITGNRACYTLRNKCAVFYEDESGQKFLKEVNGALLGTDSELMYIIGFQNGDTKNSLAEFNRIREGRQRIREALGVMADRESQEADAHRQRLRESCLSNSGGQALCP